VQPIEIELSTLHTNAVHFWGAGIIRLGMATHSNTVSFRLAPEFLKLLNDESIREGKKLNDCARRRLIRSLADTHQAEFKQDLLDLKADVRKLREDMATMCFALLVKVAKEKPETAEAWVRENLSP
jgi:hypothetical protein